MSEVNWKAEWKQMWRINAEQQRKFAQYREEAKIKKRLHSRGKLLQRTSPPKQEDVIEDVTLPISGIRVVVRRDNAVSFHQPQ